MERPANSFTLASLWQKPMQVLAEAVFPYRCGACGGIFQPPSGKMPEEQGNGAVYGEDPEVAFAAIMAHCFCETCAAEYRLIQSPLCPGCGRMYPGFADRDHLCGACLEHPRSFGMARAACVYDRSPMALVHAIKYRGNLRLAKPAARLLFIAFIRFWEKSDIDLIVPVPLFPRRFRQRGFNQAFLLVKDWTVLFRAARGESPPWTIDRRVLRRVRHTRPQAELDRESRRRNVRHAFALSRGDGKERVRGKRILLVDDVYTTGSTAEECARVLKKGGARVVEVLTLARALVK